MVARLDISAAPDIAGRVTLEGELDTHTAPSLAEYLEQVEPKSAVELDLAETTFISSAGLSVILNAQRRHVEQGGSLVVVAADPNVARTIEISGLSEILGLKRDEDDR